MSEPRLDSLFDAAPLLDQVAHRGALFLPASHLRLLEKLEHLSRYSHFLLVVVGLSGSGKTTLASQLRTSEAEEGVGCCYLQVAESLDSKGLYAAVAQQIESSGGFIDRTLEIEQALIDYANEQAAAGRPWQILLDDAQFLSDSALAAVFKLYDLISDPDAQPHLIMMGTPELNERLLKAPYRSVVGSRAHLMTLEPLSLEEMQGLVLHRYGELAEALGEHELKQLHNESFGLPGRVADVLERLTAAEDSVEVKDKSAVSLGRIALLGSAVVFPLLLGMVWLLYERPAEERLQIALPAPVVPISSERREAPDPLPDPSLEQRLEQVRAALEAERAQADNGKEAVVQRVQPPPAESLRQPAIVFENDQSVVESGLQAPADVEGKLKGDGLPVAPLQRPAQTNTTSAEERPSEVVVLAAPQSVTADSAKRDVTQSVSAAGASSSQRIEPVRAPGTRVLKLPVPADFVPTAAAEQAEVGRVEAGKRLTGDADELLRWDSGEYTLQLLGARNPQSVDNFIRAQADSSQFYRFDTFYKGAPWHVVIYGRYPNREAAVAAVGDLPVSLRKRRPWARSVKGVQDDILRKE